ncbi:MAG: flagellar hook-length control protein FliK [Planctomycetaceae bacterium]|nr:flagellar hook-length control protein FliK [Planctomycetaceae bacterium]
MSNLGQTLAQKPVSAAGRGERRSSRGDEPHALAGDQPPDEQPAPGPTDGSCGDASDASRPRKSKITASPKPAPKDSDDAAAPAAMVPAPVESPFQTLLNRMQVVAEVPAAPEAVPAVSQQRIAVPAAALAPVQAPAASPQTEATPAALVTGVQTPPEIPVEHTEPSAAETTLSVTEIPIAVGAANPQVAHLQRRGVDVAAAGESMDAAPQAARPALPAETATQATAAMQPVEAPQTQAPMSEQALPEQQAPVQNAQGEEPVQRSKPAPRTGAVQTASAELTPRAQQVVAQPRAINKPKDSAASILKLASAAEPGPGAHASAVAAVQASPVPVAPVANVTALASAATVGVGQQIVSAVVEQRFSSQRVTVALDPPELGAIRLSLHARGSEIRAVVEVNNPATLEHLRQETPSLIDRLASTGLNVRQIELRMSTDSDSGSPSWQFTGGHNAWQQSASQQGGWTDAESASGAVEPAQELDAAAAPVAHAGDGSVNLWI